MVISVGNFVNRNLKMNGYDRSGNLIGGAWFVLGQSYASGRNPPIICVQRMSKKCHTNALIHFGSTFISFSNSGLPFQKIFDTW